MSYSLVNGAYSNGDPVVSRQLEAPDVPICGPSLLPSPWVDSCTWSVPKYEKPGEVFSAFWQ
jgi:hypothetical protein